MNKGLRLDYVVCSESLFGGGSGEGMGKQKRGKDGSVATAGGVIVHDCFQLDKTTVGLSDHCPVGVTLRLPT